MHLALFCLWESSLIISFVDRRNWDKQSTGIVEDSWRGNKLLVFRVFVSKPFFRWWCYFAWTWGSLSPSLCSLLGNWREKISRFFWVFAPSWTCYIWCFFGVFIFIHPLDKRAFLKYYDHLSFNCSFSYGHGLLHPGLCYGEYYPRWLCQPVPCLFGGLAWGDVRGK